MVVGGCGSSVLDPQEDLRGEEGGVVVQDNQGEGLSRKREVVFEGPGLVITERV